MLRFINGDYTWDNKITTPPGLYFISILTRLYNTVQQARLINVLFNLATFLLLRLQINRYEAFSLALFPVSFFCSNLYYTDSGSTFFVLLMLRLGSMKRYYSSALAGMMAILFRQTNVIWVAFGAGCSLIQIIENLQSKQKQKSVLQKKASKLTWSALSTTSSIYLHTMYNKFWYIFKKLLPFAFTISLFVAFVIKNGSIALGNRY